MLRPEPEVRYPAMGIHSPITAGLAAHLRRIAGRGLGLRDDVFMKVGASGSASRLLMSCFAASEVRLGEFERLRPTLSAFQAARAGDTTPLDRRSLAARNGMGAGWAISGRPAPVDAEIAAIQPRYAVVAYGANDMHLGRSFWVALGPFGRNLLTLTDRLVSRGVIPILSTIAPRDDNPEADLWVPVYNAVIRAVAQARQVPLLDLHNGLLTLPGHGRANDKLHANVYAPHGVVQPCAFEEAALAYGYNLRNLVTLQALDRVRRAILPGATEEPHFDPAPPAMGGDGSPATPWEIAALPLSDARDLSRSRQLAYERYSGCGEGRAEGGPELIYRLRLAKATALRIVLINTGQAEVDLVLLDRTASPDGCVARADQRLEGTLLPGVYHLVVDTYLHQGLPRWGEYLLVVVPCAAGDPACGLPLGGG